MISSAAIFALIDSPGRISCERRVDVYHLFMALARAFDLAGSGESPFLATETSISSVHT